MTRKGSRQHPLTAEQYRYIRENAGKVPAAEIRRRLRIGKNQLEAARRRLNREGAGITLRCFRSSLEICPACGCARATVAGHDSGICEPCRRRRQLASIESEISALLQRLPPEERETYERTEAERESRADPMPAPPPTDGLNAYERARAEDAHARAVERWLIGYLGRRVRAAQKRKERIMKKL